MQRLPTTRQRLAAILPLATFVAATTHWMTWSEPIRQHFAGDVDDYERIARAAPHFTWPQITGHISMWPMHYVVGVVAWATHVPLHAVYYVLAIAVLAALVWAIDRILVALEVGPTAYALGMAAALLNPYVFRYLALAPGMINDAVFGLCVALTVLGLLERRTWLVVVALVVAALARGWSTPPLQIAAAVWLLADGRIELRRRRSAVAAAIALPFAAFGAAYWVGATTPGHAQALKDCCSLTTLTIVGDIAHLPGSAHAIAVHLARTAIGIAMPLAVVLAAAALRLSGRARPFERRSWWLLLVSAVLVAEPILLSSAWNDGAEPRLVSYATVPAAALAALALDRLDLSRRVAAACLVLFAVASFSHRFAHPGPHTAGQFAALVFACGALVFLLVAGTRLAPRREPATRPRTE